MIKHAALDRLYFINLSILYNRSDDALYINLNMLIQELVLAGRDKPTKVLQSMT